MLLADAQHVTARLLQLDAARNSVEEAEILANLGQELRTKETRLRELIDRAVMLRNEGVPMTVPSDIRVIADAIVKLKTRFTEAPKSSTLKQGKRWTNLVDKLNDLLTTFDVIQRQDWKQYFGSRLFAGLSPEQRRSTLVLQLPGNKEAIGRYTEFYARFNRYRQSIPPTPDALRDVLYSSGELAQIAFVETNEMPEPVKLFLMLRPRAQGPVCGR